MTPNDDLATLELAMLDAHEREDADALVSLYSKAGELKELAGNIDAACFYYTHAYVFALETGNAQSVTLLQKLVVHGRDAYPADAK